jgi:hypothetical protein
LKLEKKLASAGIPLFAADEPIDVEGMTATTILVRRVKQGIAEWYRFQIKEKAWKGLREHAMDGWNIGPAPYGYAPERIPHSVPVKAAQGRTKTRLVLDPVRAPVVEQIFTWRTVDKLGMPEISTRFNADHHAYPPPREGAGWSVTTIHRILSNPKYTGHMVFGRRRTQAGQRGRQVPPENWMWSAEQTHPPIISRATWDAAQPWARPTAPAATATPPARIRVPAAPTCCAAGSAAAPAGGACTAPPGNHRATTPAARMCSTPTTCAPTTPTIPATPRRPPTTPPPSPSGKTC